MRRTNLDDKTVLLNFGIVIMLIMFFYFLIAAVTFQFRHPWMTDTERTTYFWSALTYQTVEYKDVRPR